jgi:hypothetical protein
MSHRDDQDRQAEIDARQTAARRFGFILGCIAAMIAAIIQFIRLRNTINLASGLTVTVMAALNIPLGILFALIGERVSRSKPGED